MLASFPLPSYVPVPFGIFWNPLPNKASALKPWATASCSETPPRDTRKTDTSLCLLVRGCEKIVASRSELLCPLTGTFCTWETSSDPTVTQFTGKEHTFLRWVPRPEGSSHWQHSANHHSSGGGGRRGACTRQPGPRTPQAGAVPELPPLRRQQVTPLFYWAGPFRPIGTRKAPLLCAAPCSCVKWVPRAEATRWLCCPQTGSLADLRHTRMCRRQNSRWRQRGHSVNMSPRGQQLPCTAGPYPGLSPASPLSLPISDSS